MVSKTEGSRANDICQKGGCNKVVLNRRFCDVHAKEESWRFENERLKFRQQMKQKMNL